MTISEIKVGQYRIRPIDIKQPAIVAAVAIQDTGYMGKPDYDTQAAYLRSDGKIRWEAFDLTGEGLTSGKSSTDFYPPNVQRAVIEMLKQMTPRMFRPKPLSKPYLTQVNTLLEDAYAYRGEFCLPYDRTLGVCHQIPNGDTLRIYLTSEILSDLSLSPAYNIYMITIPTEFETLKSIGNISSNPSMTMKKGPRSQVTFSNIKNCEEEQALDVYMYFDSDDANRVLRELLAGKKVSGITRF